MLIIITMEKARDGRGLIGRNNQSGKVCLPARGAPSPMRTPMEGEHWVAEIVGASKAGKADFVRLVCLESQIPKVEGEELSSWGETQFFSTPAPGYPGRRETVSAGELWAEWQKSHTVHDAIKALGRPSSARLMRDGRLFLRWEGQRTMPSKGIITDPAGFFPTDLVDACDQKGVVHLDREYRRMAGDVWSQTITFGAGSGYAGMRTEVTMTGPALEMRWSCRIGDETIQSEGWELVAGCANGNGGGRPPPVAKDSRGTREVPVTYIGGLWLPGEAVWQWECYIALGAPKFTPGSYPGEWRHELKHLTIPPRKVYKRVHLPEEGCTLLIIDEYNNSAMVRGDLKFWDGQPYWRHEVLAEVQCEDERGVRWMPKKDDPRMWVNENQNRKRLHQSWIRIVVLTKRGEVLSEHRV